MKEYTRYSRERLMFFAKNIHIFLNSFTDHILEKI